MKTIVLRLDTETRRKLEILAEATGYERELLVSEAVRRFVDTELATLAELQGGTLTVSVKQKEENKKASRLPERWNLIV